MSGIIAKLNSVYNSLPDSEKRVSRYIFKNENSVPLQTIHEVANSSSVSSTTVLRLIRKIGYSSFKNFKIDLAKGSTSKLTNIYSEIKPEDSDKDLVKKVFFGNMKSLEDTLGSTDIINLIKVSKILAKSKRIVLFGVGGSGIVADDAALRFSHLDIQSEAYSDSLRILLQAKRLKKGDATIGITHSGRTSIIIDSLNIAQTNGATTIGISNYMNSPIIKVCDYFFYTLFKEDIVRVAALSSNIAQLCLIDAIYLLVAKYKSGIWDINVLNKFIEDSLRIKY